ncbi:hypothetical protein [Streptomyces buecherae]|uniref:HTTM domain-containing protein n=1 Tax=Streptomyces buecherae TaxID=2763006 RepID=A0A7H8NGK7_9ACTN|nr:hypothetical protein [Streptomyces buecherae]QKW53635.1 hypothetical protein HUT08_33400 [Streptomyces buecherae]
MTLTTAEALRAVEVLAAIGMLITSVEFLARPTLFGPTSLASWDILHLSHRSRLRQGRLLAYPSVLVVLAVRSAAAAVLIPWPLPAPAHAATLATVVLTSVLLQLRGPYGGEGSDQMLLLVFTVLALTALHPHTSTMRLSLYFLAVQSALAYFTSGIYKAASPVWRNGSALAGILGTRCFGHPRLAVLATAYPAPTAWTARAVIVFETLFPLVLLTPSPALPLFLAGGVLFHLTCAVAMGLNVFFWAFTATYPALAYVALSR